MGEPARRQFVDPAVAALTEENERLRDLVARLRAELHKDKSIDFLARVRRRWALTGREAAMLEHLYARRGSVATYDGLMSFMYGDEADDEPDLKIVSVYICKLRKKLGHSAFTNVHGVGYALAVEISAEITSLLADPTPAPAADEGVRYAPVYLDGLDRLGEAESPITKRELSVKLGRDPGNDGGAIQRLMVLGLAEQCGYRPPTSDCRRPAALYRLTEAGRARWNARRRKVAA